MSLLSTPPFFIFSKTPAKLHHHYTSLSPLPSSTPLLSSSSSSSTSTSRICFSAPKFSITSDEDNDEWGQDSKSKPKSKPKQKPKSKSNSITVGPPGLKVSLNVPDEWGEKSGPEPEPDVDDEWGQEPESEPEPSSSSDATSFFVGTPELNVSVTVPDEWGEKSGPDPEPESKFTGPDPPIREDEDAWGPQLPTIGDAEKLIDSVDGSGKESKNWDLKRSLLDSLYGSELGFRASAEVRAEVSELVSQLEAGNPNPSPTEVPGLLDGNWVLVYTAFSELLPILAVGATPLLKVQQISQAINTMNQSVENSTILSSPFATFSFSATASFDVRSSSRIQVRFKEATFKPPEIKSQFDLPSNIDVFGQNITLSPVQQLLNPVQEAAASISRALYGLPPLKIPIPGERAASWLLFTYVDEDFRISRGDGGIFVLVRDGSPLLDQ